MKVGKQYMGKVVEIQWMDPGSWRGDVELMRRGRQALATWRDLGRVMDITDGVVLLAQAVAAKPGLSIDQPDEVERAAVPEVLIERMWVYPDPTEVTT